jgi:hypothetical protein
MKQHVGVIALAGLALFGAPTGAHAGAITFKPAKQTLPLGSAFTIDLLVDLGDSADLGLGAFDVTLEYDSGLLQLDAYTLGTSLGAVDGVESDDLSSSGPPGLLTLAQLSYLPPAALAALQPEGGAFTLATLSFNTLASGVAAMAVFQAVLASAEGIDLPADLGKAQAGFRIAEQAPAPEPVPEPASLLLLGTGLAAAVASRRRVASRP